MCVLCSSKQLLSEERRCFAHSAFLIYWLIFFFMKLTDLNVLLNFGHAEAQQGKIYADNYHGNEAKDDLVVS